MRKEFWNSEVQKNWDGTLREDMLSHNILCYGKAGTGKTEKVVMPFLRNAIERNRSVLLVTTRETDVFDSIIEQGEETGYQTMYLEPVYFGDYSIDKVTQSGHYVLHVLMKEPIFVHIVLDPSQKHKYNTITALLYTLAQDERYMRKKMEFRELSIVIEDSNWEAMIPSGLSKCSFLNFCITTDCRRLVVSEFLQARMESLRHRLELDKVTFGEEANTFNTAFRNALQNQDHKAVKDILQDNVQIGDFYAYLDPAQRMDNAHMSACFFQDQSFAEREIIDFTYDNTGYAMRDFFGEVQTVICTGADTIVPRHHKLFLQACVVGNGYNPPGGRFLVTDLSAPSQAIPKSVFPKTVLNTAKKTAEEALRRCFRPGRCVLEQNGVVKLYAAYDGTLRPMSFSTCIEAMAWLERYYSQMGWGWPEPVEMDACCFRYLLPTKKENGEYEEITIAYVQKDDVQAYIDQAMMLLMGVEEYLTKPELMAEVPGLDRKKDAPNISLQKLADHVCQNYYTVKKIGKAELPVDEDTQQQVASMIEEYKWRPYRKVVTEMPVAPKTAMEILPKKRVLFLGGHANMVKRLRQVFPDWDFLTDDELGSWTGSECDVIFFWSKHCSHPLQWYVDCRKSKDTPYLYVTATNIDRLINEMAEKYESYSAKQNAADAG